VDVAPELELDGPGEDDQELLGVPVGVRLRSGGTTLVELADEHLEVQQRAWREQSLGAENAEGQGRAIAAPKHLRLRGTARVEQVRDADAERAGDSPKRGNARTRAAALDLAQEALADARTLCDRPQRGAAEPA
jgi:hypothetical protein